MLQLSFGEKESFGVWIPHCGRVIPLILRNARSTQWRKAELVERKQCGGKEGRKEDRERKLLRSKPGSGSGQPQPQGRSLSDR